MLITLGYAQSSRTGALRQLWVFLSSYPDILASAVAFALLVMVAVTSVRIARRRLKYETWWVVHLYTYIALALAFAHQIATGASFRRPPPGPGHMGHGVGGALPGWSLSIAWACPSPATCATSCASSGCARKRPACTPSSAGAGAWTACAVTGGQFFQWRFLTRGLWWQAHPYSLSALPRPPMLRVTVKAVGDHSSAIAALRPGTRVWVEGPYGAFTHHAQSTGRVALIAAGVGITPMRAMLEDLPASVDVAVVVRASSSEDLVHRDEIAALVAERGGRAFTVLGPRHKARLDARALRHLVPDLGQRDVYICGPSGFSQSVVSAARQLGVHQGTYPPRSVRLLMLNALMPKKLREQGNKVK